MAFQISPGVNVSEIDLTTIVPTVSVSAGGAVGVFRWGPLNVVTLIGSEDELASKFGKPDSNTATSFFTASNFLAYSDKLRLVRVAAEGVALNATAENTTGGGSAGTGLLIKNDDHYVNNFATGQANVGLFAAKHPGAIGNSLKVSLCPSASAFSQTFVVSTSGTSVTGTGFTAGLAVGTILISAAGDERKVTAIGGNTAATIASAFPVDLSSATVTAKWEYFRSFDSEPGTSVYAANHNASNDELHVIVIDEDGAFTGIANTVVEKFGFISKASDAKSEDGSSTYYAARINSVSRYIRWMDHLPAGTNWGTASPGTTYTAVNKGATYSLTGGLDGASVADSDKERGFDLFRSADQVDVGLIMCGEASYTVANYVIQNVCEVRKDCLAFVSPALVDVVNAVGSEVANVVAYRNNLTSSSYAVMSCNWKYQYDKFNDTFRWVPDNGDIAGLCARTDTVRDPWWSPGGYNRGIIKNVVKLAWNPYKSQRDDLYVTGINPVITEPGQGTLLFGDKTLLAKPSAFDRINVRRLFIVLEKAIARAAKYMLFEFNDSFTRQQFKNLVEPYLRDVQGRRGINDFFVKCDAENNTGEVIDRNEFVGDIYIKPARSINFIQLNFVAVRSGVEFSEVVGKF